MRHLSWILPVLELACLSVSVNVFVADLDYFSIRGNGSRPPSSWQPGCRISISILFDLGFRSYRLRDRRLRLWVLLFVED